MVLSRLLRRQMSPGPKTYISNHYFCSIIIIQIEDREFCNIDYGGKDLTLCNKSKTRVSVTMTRPYLDALDQLVEEGIYLGRGEAILAALRVFLREQGIEPFCPEIENSNG